LVFFFGGVESSTEVESELKFGVDSVSVEGRFEPPPSLRSRDIFFEERNRLGDGGGDEAEPDEKRGSKEGDGEKSDPNPLSDLDSTPQSGCEMEREGRNKGEGEERSQVEEEELEQTEEQEEKPEGDKEEGLQEEYESGE